MNSTDTKYIAENFIEKKALLNHFGFDEEFFENLIREKIIPGSSYTIETVIKITSPLGDTSDQKYFEEYFAKNTLSLIEQYLKSNFTAESKKQISDRISKKVCFIIKTENLLTTIFLTEIHLMNKSLIRILNPNGIFTSVAAMEYVPYMLMNRKLWRKKYWLRN